MIEIIRAERWIQYRRFCLFQGLAYRENGFPQPDALCRMTGRPPANGAGLRSMPHVMLMAAERGKILARMLVCVDETGNGCFSLFEALENEQAVRRLLDEAVRWLKIHGGRRMTGPVAPDLLDLEPGILKEGFEKDAAFGDRLNPPYYGEFLQRYGFREESEQLVFRLRTDGAFREKYCETAEWCGRKMHLRAWDLSRYPRELSRVLHETLENESPGQEMINRMVGRLTPFLSDGICPAVFDQRTGEAVGCAIALGDGRRKPVRIANAVVAERWRRRGAAVMLMDAALDALEKRGAAEADISFVRSDNLASKMTVQKAGGRLIHRYSRYVLEI